MTSDTVGITTEQIVREALVFQINESRVRQVQLATLPTEMALLAAQQVNEVRLNALEAPKEVGWGDIAFELVLGFAINSGFAEKLTAKLFQKVYGRILSNQKLLAAIGSNKFGRNFVSKHAQDMLRDRAKASQMLKALNSGATTFVKVVTKDPMKVLEDQVFAAESKLAIELVKYVKPGEFKKEELTIYVKAINEFVFGEKKISALMKGTKDAIKKGPTKKPTLSTTDGSTVAIMEFFLSAARAQKLHIESLHNRYEHIARTYPLSRDSVVLLHDMFDLSPIFESLDEDVSLDAIGSGMRLRMEAMIWAVHLGFSSKRRAPDVRINNDPGDFGHVFDTIKGEITRYLFDRFGGLVEQHKRTKGGEIEWSQQSLGQKGKYLREYFWVITDEFK